IYLISYHCVHYRMYAFPTLRSSDLSGLEKSVTEAFNSLGFESTKIGGNGKPDGKAVAYLGPLNSPENYSVTFDAKSTSKDKIKRSEEHTSELQSRENLVCCLLLDNN